MITKKAMSSLPQWQNKLVDYLLVKNFSSNSCRAYSSVAQTLSRQANAASPPPPPSSASATNNTSNKSESSLGESKQFKWSLLASVCIERLPIITCDMNDLEKRYANLINQMNIRKSLLSDHELRHLKDLEIANKRKQSKEQENKEIVIETALDFEDKCIKELQSLSFSDRKSSTSQNNNSEKNEPSVLKTLDRILDKKLVLVVYDKETSKWHLPKIKWQADHNSLRDSAERAIINLNKDLKVDFLGNAPVGVYKRKIEKDSGEKHYFFKAQYKSGGEILAKSEVDFAWIRKDELKDFIKDEDYLECLNNFILDF